MRREKRDDEFQPIFVTCGEESRGEMRINPNGNAHVESECLFYSSDGMVIENAVSVYPGAGYTRFIYSPIVVV